MRLCELAGVDPVDTVLALTVERASTPEDREFWETLLARVSKPGKAKKAHQGASRDRLSHRASVELAQ